MTPMIDIVFQLLIFFLTTAQMVNLSRANVNLPEEKGEQLEAKEPAQLIINLLESGEIIISDRTIDSSELESMIKQAIKRAPNEKAQRLNVVIRADRNATSNQLNAVIERLHRMGVALARVATSPRGN